MMDNSRRKLYDWITKYQGNIDFQHQVDRGDLPILKDERLYKIVNGLEGLRYQSLISHLEEYEQELTKDELLPERWDWYQRYMIGTLTPDELLKFDAILKTNPQLHEEYLGYLETEKVMQDYGKAAVMNSLQKLEKERGTFRQDSKRSYLISSRFMAIAAAIVILVGASLWLIAPGQGGINLASEFIKTEQRQFRNSSSEEIEFELSSLTTQNLSDFIADSSLLNIAARSLIAANIYFENNEYLKAAEYYQQVLATGDNRYLDQAKWNLMLCYYLLGENESGRIILESFLSDSSHPFYQRSLLLRKKIK